MKIKKRWIAFIVIISLCIYAIEKRSFYCLENGKCVTVWKNIGGSCYIMPYRYYGLFHPSDGYIKTSNLSYIDFFYLSEFPDEIIIRVSYDTPEIINSSSKNIQMFNFYDNEEEFKRVLFDKNGFTKDSVGYIFIDIGDNRLIKKKSNYSANPNRTM